MVRVIFTVMSSTIAVLSGLLTVWQWLESNKNRSKRKTALIFGGFCAISLILTIVNIPETNDIIEEYKEYQKEVVAQQEEDDRCYNLAQEYIEEGNIFEAIRQLQNISSHYRFYGEVQELLSLNIEKYRSNVLDEAEELSKEGKLDDAINVIKTAMFLLPNDNDLGLKLEKYTNDLSQNIVDGAIVNATNYANEKNYSAAILVIQEALKYYPENQELKLKISDYENKYIDDILITASTYVTEHNVDLAVDVLNEALSIVPENRELKEKLVKYKSITKNLSTLTYLNQNGYLEDTDITVANDGSLVNNGFILCHSESFRRYPLDGNYSAIVGTFALTDESKNDDVRCVLTIDVDGKEYILEMRAGVRPIPFDIPLSNAQNITFTLFSEGYWTKVVIGNTILYKTD